MKIVKIIWLLILFAPLSLWSQSDTIRIGEIPNKCSRNVIYETTIDIVTTIVINEFLARNASYNADEAGDYDDWIELYNYGDLPVKIDNLWFSDNPQNRFKWKLNSNSTYLNPGEYFLIWADGEPDEGDNHTSFKLSGDGEYIGIWNPDTSLVDEIYYGKQSSNVSYGRFPDGTQHWQYCIIPSPGEYNTSGGEFILPALNTNHVGGIYQNPIILNLSSNIPDCDIRYTLDCNEPTNQSLLYKDFIRISETTIVRARLIKEGYISGEIMTISFLFEEDEYENPIVSLVSTPDNFYGRYGLISYPWIFEIPANFEFIENGIVTYSGGTGIQNHSIKRTKPNSMKLYARSRYGEEWFDYPFFEDLTPTRYKRLILRNAGNDNLNKVETNSHMRDPLASAIAEEVSNNKSMTSASRPVNVFINGEYYGLFNLRERIDEYYIKTHTSTTENFDLLERSFGHKNNRNAIVGSFEKWDELLKFVDITGNLVNDDDFQYLKSQVDIDNFTDYWITEVFLGNYDWLSNNIKFWKSENGKWQWIYWDMDHSIGLSYLDYGNVDWNTLNWSLGFTDRAQTNGNNNILIRNLLMNDTYKEFFIKRFTHLLNTTFSYKETQIIAETMRKAYKNDLSIHAERWDRDMNDWNKANKIIERYLAYRPAEQLKHLQSYFNIAEPVKVSFNCIPPGRGSISIDEYVLTSDSCSGNYFPNMVYELTAIPISGYILHDFIINGESSDSSSIFLSKDTEITAVFIPEDPVTTSVTEFYFDNREDTHSRTLKHYPTPASNEFFIELPESNTCHMEFFIFDLMGNIVEKFTLNHTPEKLQVNVQSLSSGMYFFYIKIGDYSYYGKIEVMKYRTH